ncbi:MAG: hypothetical protein WCS28_12805, partial [Thiomicrospira sp.]
SSSREIDALLSDWGLARSAVESQVQQAVNEYLMNEGFDAVVVEGEMTVFSKSDVMLASIEPDPQCITPGADAPRPVISNRPGVAKMPSVGV